MALEIGRLVKAINQSFREPFLPDGFVRAVLRDDGGFSLHVGGRDVQFNERGESVGAGTLLDCWTITRG